MGYEKKRDISKISQLNWETFQMEASDDDPPHTHTHPKKAEEIENCIIEFCFCTTCGHIQNGHYISNKLNSSFVLCNIYRRYSC